MTSHALIPDDLAARYEVHEWRNGLAVLSAVHRKEWRDIQRVLREFKLLRSDMIKPGGRKSDIAGKLDSHFYHLGWKEKAFDTRIVVDNTEYKAPTHKVDCYKDRVALEVEWNAKDAFFDRDLNNFRLLFELRVIDVGVIITRCRELHPLLKGISVDRGGFSASTTHLEKLLPRLEGGAGGGCPVVAFGITKAAYVED